MSKSIIKKSISRGIQTKKFEQVTISVDIEEEVEWNTDQERDDGAKKVTDLLMKDFKNTYNEVVNILGVDRCIGHVEVPESAMKNTNSSIVEDDDDDFGF